MITVERPTYLEKTRTLVDHRHLEEFVGKLMKLYNWSQKDRITIEPTEIAPYIGNNE
jgi:hypothetical protein